MPPSASSAWRESKAIIWKMLQVAEKSRRKPNAPQLLPLVTVRILNHMMPKLGDGPRTVAWSTWCRSLLGLSLLMLTMFDSSMLLGQTTTIPPAGSKSMEMDVDHLHRDRLGLEKKKLQLEIEHLEKEKSWTPPKPWDLIATAIVSALFTMWVARRTRWGTFDLAVVQKRLEWYPKLIKATELFALYFPGCVVDCAKCEQAGTELRTCYFGGAGILLSTEARDSYFMLVEALTRAAVAGRLDVPELHVYTDMMSVSQMADYRQRLAIAELTMESVKRWTFGASQHNPEVQQSGQGTDNSAQSFRDYVFLQTVASRLRSELSADINGRRRPQ